MSHRCKLRHRKKVLENFRKLISQEPHVRILISSAYCLYLDLLFKWQFRFIIMILISKYNFHEKSYENCNSCFAKVDERYLRKTWKLADFELKLHHWKCLTPTAWGLKLLPVWEERFFLQQRQGLWRRQHPKLRMGRHRTYLRQRWNQHHQLRQIQQQRPKNENLRIKIFENSLWC